MDVCNQKMIREYVMAALIARKYNVKNSTVQNAVSRLAYFTDYLGDDKMKPYVEAAQDPLSPGSKLVVHQRRVLAVALGRRGHSAAERATRAVAGSAVREKRDPMKRRASAVWRIGALAWPAPRGACGGAKPAANTAAQPAATTADAVAAPAAATVAPVVGVAAPAAASDDMPSGRQERLHQGLPAWAAGDLAGAKAAFSDAASRAPKAGGPRYSLGCVLERLGDAQGALDAYRAAYGANPKYEVAMGAYAVGLARTGRGPDAEQFLADKRAQNPDSARLTTYLAEVKSIEGDSPGCQQLAQQALTKQPDFKDAMIVIARDFYRSHRWDLAQLRPPGHPRRGRRRVDSTPRQGQRRRAAPARLDRARDGPAKGSARGLRRRPSRGAPISSRRTSTWAR